MFLILIIKFLMTFMNEEQLETIEEMAYRLFSPTEIALALEISDIDAFVDDLKCNSTEIHKAFYKGYFSQLGELRNDTIKAARNGSNPAQLELIKCLNNIQRELNHG